MSGPFISFLSDFGDTAPAVCRGVIWSIEPDARILDLTHAVRKFAVRDGAFLLWSAIPYLPIGVHLAVVDPGVGTRRRPVALRAARGDLLVGPDNGILMPAAERLGGIVEVRLLENRSFWRNDVSATFHGRDIFAPVAAHLARGTDMVELGPRLAVEELAPIHIPEAEGRDDGLDTTVIFIDSFGNCRLAGQSADLAGGESPADGTRFRVELPGRTMDVAWWPTFGAVAAGTALLYEDADYAGLALGVNHGSAAALFNLALDVPVRIRRP